MVLMAGCAFAEMGPRIGPDKKIIHLPQSWPDAAYCRANVREMERLPFDGIGIWPYAEIDGKRENLWTRWFHPERIPEDLVADTVRNLKATEFRKFTDNFLYMASLCFPLDTPGWWDDDAWEKITANMALAARIARDCKLKGIMLDVEQYGESSHTYWFRFNYSDAHAKEKKLLAAGKIDRIHTWEEFAAGARRRGRQIMAAMCEVYPEITLISILGFHDVAKRGGQNRDADAWERDGLPISSYALLAPFTDGLMEGAAKEATIIDGAESAYPFKLNKQFVERRATIENAFDVSAVPDLYKKKMNVAFGLMLDYGYHSGRWHTDPGELHRNHFTPAQFGSALYFAMLNTDRYVWVWSELDGAVFLENVYGHWQDPAEHVKPTVPEEYLVEIGRAREPRDLATGTDHSAIANKPHRMKNAIYEKELETVLAATDKVFALPKDGWRFKMDWRDLGLGANWHLPTTATEDWLEIETEAFWGAKGGTGVGWYRRDIDVPVLPRGKRVYLHFGAVDEQIVLWIDGEHVGDYNRDPDEGWDQPFAIDVTGKLTTGKHHLAMRVDNRIAAGGIWKPVSVRAGGDTADAEEGL
jgi:hypothetical protein